jgi:beta-lactamase superfamily II metal-dependent hydrolase
MKFSKIVLTFALAAFFAIRAFAADGQPAQGGDQSASFTLWQLPNQTHSQMMSYVLRTNQGKLIVIDGGTAGDAAYLRDFIKARGEKVEAWFITHPHDDHYDALREILLSPESVTIGHIYASMPDAEWIRANAPGDEIRAYDQFMETIGKTQRKIEEVSLGQTFNFDGALFEIIGVKNPELRGINNSSIVMRVSDAHKSILFLADLGVQGGRKLLKGDYASKLPSDFVQMAHHGQNGVEENVYQKIAPQYCLWTTPEWLWDNDCGKGKGSGRWKTLEVREWMDKLHVKKNYVMKDGLQEID